MTKSTKQRPVKTLRDGAIKAAIWRNESDNGPFFAVTFARTYKDGEGKLQDTDSFSGTQLLLRCAGGSSTLGFSLTAARAWKPA